MNTRSGWSRSSAGAASVKVTTKICSTVTGAIGEFLHLHVLPQQAQIEPASNGEGFNPVPAEALSKRAMQWKSWSLVALLRYLEGRFIRYYAFR